MKSPLRLMKLFSFPPRNQEDMKIMKYIEFLEIEEEVNNSSQSPEVFYQVMIDPRAVRCCPRFIEFIDNYGSYETSDGRHTIGDCFKYSHEETTDLLFFVIGDKSFLIDHEGYVHLGILSQQVGPEEAIFFKTILTDYYRFKLYGEK